MKRQHKSKRKRFSRKHPLYRFMKGNILIPIIFVVVAFAVLLTSGAMYNKSATDPSVQFNNPQNIPDNNTQGLHLNGVKLSKITPTPTPTYVPLPQISMPIVISPSSPVTTLPPKRTVSAIPTKGYSSPIISCPAGSTPDGPGCRAGNGNPTAPTPVLR